MLLNSRIHLTCSLIALLSTATSISCASEPQLPEGLAPHDDTSKRTPLGQEKALEARFAQTPPVAVRKMSADSSEMFFQEYWGFDHPNTIAKGLDSDITFSNSSIPLLDTLLQPPVLPHSSSSSSAPLLLRALYRRSFTCPTGTNSCASIGASYGCCPVGTTCQLSGSGELGCCPGDAASCSGSTPTQCEAGYTSCPEFHGGSGCCLDGFTCQSDGCKHILSLQPPPPREAELTSIQKQASQHPQL